MKIPNAIVYLRGLFTLKTNSALDNMVSRVDIERKQKQGIRKRITYLFLMGFVVFLIFVFIDAVNKMNKNSEVHAKRTDKAKVELKADNFALWQVAKDDQLKGIETEITKIENNITGIVNQNMNRLSNELNSSISSIATELKENNIKQINKIESIKTDLEQKIITSQEESGRYVDEKIKTLSFKNIDLKNDPALFLPAPSASSKQAGNATPPLVPKNKTTTIITEEEPVLVVDDNLLTTLKKEDSNKTKEKEIEFDIPMGMAKATLVSGVNAPIFNLGRDDGTKPVFLSIDSQIILANNQVLDGRECMILGSAVGDLSDSRAEIRLSKISCTFINQKNGKTYKVEDKIEGWVFGEDGGLGPKGRLVTKEGKIITAALPLALLETAMSYVSDKAKEGTSIYTTGTSTVPVTGYVNQGASKGAENVISKLSEIYVKYIEALNPVISIMPGREVTIAFKGTTAPLKLKEFNGLDVGFFDREGGDTTQNNIREDNYYNHSTISGVEIYE